MISDRYFPLSSAHVAGHFPHGSGYHGAYVEVQESIFPSRYWPCEDSGLAKDMAFHFLSLTSISGLYDGLD